MPFMNKSTSFLRGPAVYLDDNNSVQSITQEEINALSKKDSVDFAVHLVKSPRVCYMRDITTTQTPEYLQGRTAGIRFLFNTFRTSDPIVCPSLYILSGSNKLRLTSVHTSDNHGNLNIGYKYKYKMRAGITRENISNMFAVINKALAGALSLALTLDRFNSALIRTSEADRIVDLTISMESLIPGDTELAYKFALYNSIFATTNPDERLDTFKLLQALYGARSKIVHGESISDKKPKKNIDDVLTEWDRLLDIANKSITYYMLYLFNHSIDNWSIHLKKLALGVDKRIGSD
jgi:hypothetical protein